MKTSSAIPRALLLMPLMFFGCRENNTVVGPKTELPAEVTVLRDSVLFSLSLSQPFLGVLDSLDATVSALNKSSLPETLWVGQPNYEYYSWSIINAAGHFAFVGPAPFLNAGYSIIFNPHQTVMLYHLRWDLFACYVDEGYYTLKLTLWPPTFAQPSNGFPSVNLELMFLSTKNGAVHDLKGVASPIYPLRVGNQWTYQRIRIDSGAEIVDTVTQRITAEIMLDSEFWFVLSTNAFPTHFLTARPDGIYEYFPRVRSAVLRFKYPASMGDGYTSGSSFFTGSQDTLITFPMTVDSIDERVCVTAGNYRCNKYHSANVTGAVGNWEFGIEAEDDFLSDVGPVLIRRRYELWQLLSMNTR